MSACALRLTRTPKPSVLHFVVASTQPYKLKQFVHLQARNEELVIKAAKVSEEDMAAVQAECERRLGAAERKVYALVKERDALRRGSEKLSSAHDLLKEKDSIIAQV